MKLEIFNGPEQKVEKGRLRLKRISDDEIALEVVDAQGELIASVLAVRGGKHFDPTGEGKPYVVLYSDGGRLQKAGFAVEGNRVSTPLN